MAIDFKKLAEITNKGKSVTTPIKGGVDFNKLNQIAKGTIPATKTNTPKPTTRIASLPSFLGGGEYKVDKPGEVTKTFKSQNALGPTKEGYERDHKVSYALGGTSSKNNLQYLPNNKAGQQAGKVLVEQEAIRDYQNGVIKLGEAREKIATKNQQILGLTPTPEEQTVKGQLKKGIKNIFNKITGKETLKQNFATQDRGLEYKPQATPSMTSNITEGKMTTTPITTDYGTKEAAIDLGKFVYNEAKKPITNAIANKDLTEEQAKAKVMQQTIGKKGVDNKIGTLNKILSMYNPEAEQVQDLTKYDETFNKLTPEQQNLVKAEEKAEGAFKLAKVPTAPARFLAGMPAVALISVALEKSNSDLSVDPTKIKNEKDRDLMRLLTGDTEVKRLMESDDMYGMVARSGAGMLGAVALMAILENPFVAGTGASVLLKEKIKKEAAEMIVKFGYKEYLKTVVKDTEKAIMAELKAGNISREMAEVALKEIGLPKSLAKELESEKLFEIKPKVEPNKAVVEATQKPQEARVEQITKKMDIEPSKEKVVKSEPIKEPVKKLDSLNPTGSVFSKYTPEQRAIAELADNITTLDKTSGKKADEVITIYRGVPDGNKKIVAGDFITTNKQLAKDYAGTGVVVEKKVKMSDVLDDISEPLGEEYIYRPKQSKIAELAKEEKTSKIVIDKAKENAEKAVLPKLEKEASNIKPTPSKTKPLPKPKTPVKEALEQEAKKYKNEREFITKIEKSIVDNDKNILPIFNNLIEIKNVNEFGKGKIEHNFIPKQKSIEYWEKQIKNGERPFVYIEDFSNNKIVSDGNHRLQAYKNLGIEEIPTLDKSQLTDIWNKANKTVENKGFTNLPKRDIIEVKKLSEKAMELTKKNDGVTISLKGDIPTTGYVYSPSKLTEKKIPVKDLKTSDIEDYILEHYDELQDPKNHFGNWKNGDEFVMDVSRVEKDVNKASVGAKLADQDGIFNLDNFETINRKDYEKLINNAKTKNSRLPRQTNVEGGTSKGLSNKSKGTTTTKGDKGKVTLPKISEVKAKKEKEEFTSRVFERMQAENPELLKGDLKATKVHLDNESKKAIEIMERDKQKAYNLAMGREESSDVLGTSVNIAMTEKALEEGNTDLAAKLIKNRSLAQTRRGQELVAETGSITNNSTSRYMKELLSNRMDKLGDKYTDGIKDVLKKGSKKENAINKIDKEIANVEIAITNKKLDTKTALALLEKMTCI